MMFENGMLLPSYEIYLAPVERELYQMVEVHCLVLAHIDCTMGVQQMADNLVHTFPLLVFGAGNLLDSQAGRTIMKQFECKI